MGLFDSIAGQVAGALSGQSGAQGSGLLQILMSLINNPQTGGLQGLIAAFQDKGLGDLVSSWVGTGQNLPITPEQLQSVLGSGQIGQIAQQLGLSSQEVSGQLSALLPQVIDGITPNGQVPEGDAMQNALGMLSGLLK
ncbi:YidB family protein [Methyloversatilis sp.]|uniref:YidB family protein n=1 Tax=Methyloversatilis sp. TaxID=2569862 RepID=UPI0027360591|nr:YidB family protein [Methyloversatilis sp.]MDP2867333.1 YidB family protein [Methyloversatilis sp.]MDP3456957.1 YidB family protein [Methyloversatilis sp.]MDP3579919.1 YidB family protein [Methyloversatilis sp.]